MRDCKVVQGLLKYCLQNLPTSDANVRCNNNEKSTCGGFLCVKDGSCMPDKKVTFDKGTLLRHLTICVCVFFKMIRCSLCQVQLHQVQLMPWNLLKKHLLM